MLFEQRMPSGHAGKKSTEWVAQQFAVIAALNNEVTRLTDKKPADAIKAARVPQKPSSVGSSEQKIPSSVGVCYLYQPGELEGGRRRATDPVWSLGVYRRGRSVTKPREPVLYYLQDGPARGFVREELLVIPRDSVASRWSV